ncbi:MAG: NAD(P)H-binding protein [Nitrosopumilaceae archaeon]|nr:NAD(P)H-binding protein [Nitrosopumilaceae archaeon]
MAAKIAIMGAGGYIGRNLRRVASELYDVEIAVLSRDDIIPFYFGDAAVDRGSRRDDNENLRAAVDVIRGSDALVNLVGSGRQSAMEPFSDSITTPASIAAFLCRHAGIPRVVYVSGLGASARSPIAYMASKYAAEMSVGASGLDYVIFRPSYVVGRGDHLASYVLSHARGTGIRPAPADVYECYARMQPIHVDDAAAAILWGALEAPPARMTLDLVGPDRIPFYEYVSMVSRACRVPLNPITLEQAYAQALGDPEHAAFGVDDLGIITGGYTANPRKLVRATGISPRSIVSALEAGRLP